jgi:NTP pyrophosphatase (non-canonical NTP hydrolase)
MDVAQLTERAMQVREQYAARERATYGRARTDEEIALGFIGDVGDLMKLVQARNGVRAIPDADAELAHELADCLWCLLVLAAHYGIDLERAFLETMNALDASLAPHHQA